MAPSTGWLFLAKVSTWLLTATSAAAGSEGFETRQQHQPHTPPTTKNGRRCVGRELAPRVAWTVCRTRAPECQECQAIPLHLLWQRHVTRPLFPRTQYVRQTLTTYRHPVQTLPVLTKPRRRLWRGLCSRRRFRRTIGGVFGACFACCACLALLKCLHACLQRPTKRAGNTTKKKIVLVNRACVDASAFLVFLQSISQATVAWARALYIHQRWVAAMTVPLPSGR